MRNQHTRQELAGHRCGTAMRAARVVVDLRTVSRAHVRQPVRAQGVSAAAAPQAAETVPLA